MKRIIFLLAMAVSLRGFAHDTNKIEAGFQLLVHQVKAKVASGKTNSADLKMELAGFDRLIAEEKGAKTEESAQLVYMKAMLFVQIINQPETGRKILEQIKTDYPNTQTATLAGKIATSIEHDEAVKKIRDALVVGAPVPNFAVKDVQGNPLSLADFKGKVLLIDFWSTLCGPYYDQLAHLTAIYKKYHDAGFEIIGVSLDPDFHNLEAFLRQNEGVTWHEYFDGRTWDSEMVTKFGVDFIPSSLLVGPDGRLIGKSLQGDALEQAVGAALGSK